MDAAAKRHHLISNPQSPIPNPLRSAFTLIEVLIVISIMLILITLTATMFRTDVEGRRVREAARAINVYLSSARSRAMETGRPCGVILRQFGATACAMNADQCEVPPSYCGESFDSVARVTVINNTEIHAYLSTASSIGTPETIPVGMVYRGDLIQLNSQGTIYTINEQASDPDPSSGTVSDLVLRINTSHNQNQLVPWPQSPTLSQPVPYRIFRSPIKGVAQPLQLPAATVVDLGASGAGTDFFVGATDYTIMFSPNGSVESVYLGANRLAVVEPIFLLVGDRGRIDNGFFQDNPNEDTLTNYQQMKNLWVTINPQTGLVQSEPVAAIPAGTTDPAVAIIRARDLAREALGMGGK